jgi:hypothetical protein
MSAPTDDCTTEERLVEGEIRFDERLEDGVKRL